MIKYRLFNICIFLLFVLFNYFCCALRNYKKYKITTFIGNTVQKSVHLNNIRRVKNNIFLWYIKKKGGDRWKSANSFKLFERNNNNNNNNDYNDDDDNNNKDNNNNDDDNEDDITYEEIEEYLKKNKVENYEEDEGKSEILKLINYIPTLSNEEEFFSTFGYVNREKKSMEYYFNQMKNEKERKQKKNYNILNFILSYYLKKKIFNDVDSNKNYDNIQSYCYYINNLINYKDTSLEWRNGHLSKKNNIFSNRWLCSFISFYLKNVNALKYISFGCVSGVLSFFLKYILKNIRIDNVFLLRNHFNLIYGLRHMKIYKIVIFCLFINMLFINKYNQYFSITDDGFAVLFSNYFFYEGIENLNKKKIYQFMAKYNYTLNDILYSLNDMFIYFLNKKIYVDEIFDPDIIKYIDSFISLYQKLFKTNKENIKNILTMVLNKYNMYNVKNENKNKDLLSRIFYIFYIINIKFKYDVVQLNNLNLHRENKYMIPFFFNNNKISNYFLLSHISAHLNVKEKIINNYLLEKMKNDYETYVLSILRTKKYSNSVYDDIKKMPFITLNNSVIDEVNVSIFMNIVKDIINNTDYECKYTSSSSRKNKNVNQLEMDGNNVLKDQEKNIFSNDDDSNDDDDNNNNDHSSDENSILETNIFNENNLEKGLYENMEDSVDYIIHDNNSLKSQTKNTGDISSEKIKKNDVILNEKEELKEKEQLMKKLNDIYFLRKYLNIDKEFTDNFLEKYLFKYIYKEYKIFINNLIFKKLKNKNDNLYFIKRGISLPSKTAQNIVKNIILNFVIKTKENIAIFYKLENIDKCLRLIVNLINIYKKIKKKKKFIRFNSNIFNLDHFFSYNCYKENEHTDIIPNDQNNNIDNNDNISEKDDILNDNNNNNNNKDGNENYSSDEQVHLNQPFLKEEEEFIKHNIYKEKLCDENEGKIILNKSDRKKLYEEFVLKYMKNKSERNILKTIFNLDYDNDDVDKEIEDNIIKRFLEDSTEKKLTNLKNLDMQLKIIGNDNLFDYKNMHFNEGLLNKHNLKKGLKEEENKKMPLNEFIIKKEDIFDDIDDESFLEICKKMYINKLFHLKENIYNNRKELYFYQIILNIKNINEIHDIYLIDQYEKMINDTIKTNILNKNYSNIKNLYLKKIINFLNISEEKASIVELNCIFHQTNYIFKTIKENFYIYRNDNDFIDDINEILTIYKNFDLIKKVIRNDKEIYFVKFSLVESNYNIVHKIFERYVLYVIDVITNENRNMYKDNIFKLRTILNVHETTVNDISTKIYRKYIENQDLHAINNMDSFFNFLFNMSKEEQKNIVIDFLKTKIDTYLKSDENYDEKLNKLYDLLVFINDNLQYKKNIFDLSSLSSKLLYEFLLSCVDNYIHTKKTDVFIKSQADYINHFNNFLSKIKALIRGPEEQYHLSHVLNILKNDIIKKAINLLDKFEYDMCIEEVYNLIKLQMIDENINFSDIDITKRKKLVNIFSYQNISDEKKFLYMDTLKKILL
ncbi:conserved Plasmodium protein, unknown function [Plasmodium sp. gorilla clade G2]|uniref:conserved Plasmodium protein, unknown function n=1 Tax=Plasmodium sp. gorilla clade G2 TaxID=880535 RepID=UPI000D22BB8B|nr:conserved Plasmodium protein, unknown function [Plasmodium sp. gorilla clade G2]SOV12877.1 conserved Plasmodium protein, unknown function [Plasmodium sp. gorilla clade G2]